MPKIAKDSNREYLIICLQYNFIQFRNDMVNSGQIKNLNSGSDDQIQYRRLAWFCSPLVQRWNQRKLFFFEAFSFKLFFNIHDKLSNVSYASLSRKILTKQLISAEPDQFLFASVRLPFQSNIDHFRLID